MEYDQQNTKTVLLLAAGELFAEYGLEGVSTRMIASKANANLGSIHYHFGSKENLYLETFKYIHDRKRMNNIDDVIAENPGLNHTPEGKAEIIYKTIKQAFRNCFHDNDPEWKMKLLLRELVDPSSALEMMVNEFFKPDHQSWINFYKQVKPAATDNEAKTWAHMISSQIAFHMMARSAIEMADGKTLDPEYFEALAKTVARAMILLLDLPLTDELKDNTGEQE